MNQLQTLIIKASSPAEAQEFAEARGFEVDHALTLSCPTQVAVRVKPNMNRAVAWFIENLHDGRPYPWGVLLWYSYSDHKTLGGFRDVTRKEWGKIRNEHPEWRDHPVECENMAVMQVIDQAGNLKMQAIYHSHSNPQYRVARVVETGG